MNKATMLLAAAVLIAMTGCGRSSRNAQSTATGSPAATGAPAATAAGAAAGAMPDCNGQSPVWAFYRTKVYVLPGDRLYGKTKRGYYLCLSQAQAEGYRHARGPLGHHRHHRGAFSV